MENGYFDLTNYENIIGALVLVLIIIFALAAFHDSRWRKTDPLSDFDFDHNPNCPLESFYSDDKDRASDRYARYAGLSARDLGTADQQITSRGETQQNLEGD